MAVKITHKARGQQVRFGSRGAAERYAEQHGGGLDKWEFTTVPCAADRTPHDGADESYARG